MKSKKRSKLRNKSRKQPRRNLGGTQLLENALEKIIYKDFKKTIKRHKYISKHDFKKILHKEAHKNAKRYAISKEDDPNSLDNFYWDSFRAFTIWSLKNELKTLNLLLKAERKNQNRAKKMYTRKRILSHKIPPTRATQHVLSYL